MVWPAGCSDLGKCIQLSASALDSAQLPTQLLCFFFSFSLSLFRTWKIGGHLGDGRGGEEATQSNEEDGRGWVNRINWRTRRGYPARPAAGWRWLFFFHCYCFGWLSRKSTCTCIEKIREGLEKLGGGWCTAMGKNKGCWARSIVCVLRISGHDLTLERDGYLSR